MSTNIYIDAQVENKPNIEEFLTFLFLDTIWSNPKAKAFICV